MKHRLANGCQHFALPLRRCCQAAVHRWIGMPHIVLYGISTGPGISVPFMAASTFSCKIIAASA